MALQALQVQGRSEPLRGMKFQVDIPTIAGMTPLGFSKISGISQEAELIEYRDGDNPIYQSKIPGLIKTGDVTLERGVAHVEAMEHLNAWKTSASTGLAGTADGAAYFRHDVNISVINRTGQIEWVIQLQNAWPRMVEYGDLDANSSDIWIATFTLAYEQVQTLHEVPAIVLERFPKAGNVLP